MLGRCYEKLRDAGEISAEEADPKIESAYETTIHRYPDCSFAQKSYLRLARIAVQQQHWERAGAYYTQFLQKYPQAKQWENVLVYLGLTYERRGQEQTAAELYRSYLDVSKASDARVKAIQTRLERMEAREQ